MFLKTYLPSAPLRPAIASFTYYRGYQPDYTATRMLPDGSVELIILLDDEERTFYRDAGHRITGQRALLTGVQQDFAFTKAAGSSVFAVKFKPGGSYSFLHLPLLELRDDFVEADLVLGRDILLLREKLLAERNPAPMITLVEQFLLQRMIPSHQQRCIAAAVHTLNHAKPSLTGSQLADQLGYSQKQLIHLFKQQLGVTPKTYQRLARFNRAIEASNRHTVVNWANIAHANGYYDQSHLIHDFKAIAGLLPEAYLHQKGEFATFVPIYPNG